MTHPDTPALTETNVNADASIRKNEGLRHSDTVASTATSAFTPTLMPGNVKPQHVPVYVWEPIPDPIAQPDRAWTIKRGGVSVAWAFERDQTGLGHGWCVKIGSVEASGVASTFDLAKLNAERALDRLAMEAIVAASRMIP